MRRFGSCGKSKDRRCLPVLGRGTAQRVRYCGAHHRHYGSHRATLVELWARFVDWHWWSDWWWWVMKCFSCSIWAEGWPITPIGSSQRCLTRYQTWSWACNAALICSRASIPAEAVIFRIIKSICCSWNTPPRVVLSEKNSFILQFGFNIRMEDPIGSHDRYVILIEHWDSTERDREKQRGDHFTISTISIESCNFVDLWSPTLSSNRFNLVSERKRWSQSNRELNSNK